MKTIEKKIREEEMDVKVAMFDEDERAASECLFADIREALKFAESKCDDYATVKVYRCRANGQWQLSHEYNQGQHTQY